MAKVLVTGAAGFIGSHTVDLLLAQGHAVLGLDNFRTGRRENLRTATASRAFSFTEGDIASPGIMDSVVKQFHPDAIIHLAALVSVPESIANPAENDRLNFQATQLVAEAAKAHAVKRIVFASSAAVYGANPSVPLVEQAECAPLSPYGTAKLSSEKLLLELARTHGVVARCHRYFNVFGPRQDPSSPYSGVISIFEARLKQGAPATIHGDGEQTRDFIFVGDVARANVIAATMDGLAPGVTNICTGKAVSLNLLHATIGRLLKRTLPPTYGPVRSGDIRHSCGNPGRAQRELGFTSQTPLEKGLQALTASSA